MTGLEPEAWETFAVGQLGASAALLGLVFVGISINLREVLSARSLVNRAAESVLLLAGLLLGSTAILIPEQPVSAVGVELVALGLLSTVAVLVFQRSLAAPPLVPTPDAADPGPVEVDGPVLAHVLRRLLGLGATVLLVVAGASLLLDAGGGLYWWAASVALAYAGALLGAWVLIIEILR